jgi:hypothetical protein
VQVNFCLTFTTLLFNTVKLLLRTAVNEERMLREQEGRSDNGYVVVVNNYLFLLLFIYCEIFYLTVMIANNNLIFLFLNIQESR